MKIYQNLKLNVKLIHKNILMLNYLQILINKNGIKESLL